MEKLMKRKNTLLAKDDVGRAKNCVVRLPDEHFVYGKANYRGQEGAGIITSSWKTHEQSRPLQSNVKDFKKINKLSL